MCVQPFQKWGKERPLSCLANTKSHSRSYKVLDLLLEGWTSFLIEAAKARSKAEADATWKPSRKLRVLIAAYNGARNTGEDVRVEEIVRQLRRILGEEKVDLSVFTFDENLSRNYFGDAKQIYFPN